MLYYTRSTLSPLLLVFRRTSPKLFLHNKPILSQPYLANMSGNVGDQGEPPDVGFSIPAKRDTAV